MGKSDKRAWMWWLIWAAMLLAVSACDDSLDESYADFRDNVPSVCKDYCEEMAACGRPTSTGDLEQDQFAAEVHRCEVTCASFGVEGAYVWYRDNSSGADRVYVDHLSGDMVMDAFSCLYGYGAYRCVARGGTYILEFNPPARNVCEAANDCTASFEMNVSYSWKSDSSGVGGSCQRTGNEFTDSSFF